MNKSALLIILCLAAGFVIHSRLNALGGVHKTMLKNIPLEDVDSLRRAYIKTVDHLFESSDIVIVEENDWGLCGNSGAWEIPVIVRLQLTEKENFEALGKELRAKVITEQQINQYVDSISKATGRYSNEVYSEFCSNKRRFSILSERTGLREIYFRESYELPGKTHRVIKYFRYTNGRWSLDEESQRTF